MPLHLIRVICCYRWKLLATKKHAILPKLCFVLYSCLILLGSRPQKTRMQTFSKKEYGHMAILNCSVLGKHSIPWKPCYTYHMLRMKIIPSMKLSALISIAALCSSHTKHTICNWAHLSLFILTSSPGLLRVVTTRSLAKTRVSRASLSVFQPFQKFKNVR